MSNKMMAKIMSEVIFQDYIADIKESKPFDKVLQKRNAFNGEPPHNVKFIMIGDLVKWCSLKKGSCMN